MEIFLLTLKIIIYSSIFFTGATVVSFDGTQSLLYSYTYLIKSEADDLVLRFRTRRSSGLILATTRTNASDSLVLSLLRGELRAELITADRTEVSKIHRHMVQAEVMCRSLHIPMTGSI